jgi:hypothetical protein
MIVNSRSFVFQSPDPGASGGGQPASGGGQPAGGQPAGGQPAFADAASARTYLKDYVHDEGVLSGVKDEAVLPWATHVKGKLDQLGTQFPGNWREQVAGEDKVQLKTLETFASPKALFNSYAALRGKLSSGELRAVVPFPATGTDVEKAAWRQDNNVPARAEDYKFEPSKGRQLAEQDKEVVSEYQKAAFAQNMRPEHFQATLNWWFGERQRQRDAVRESDTEFQLTSEDELRSEWGQGYRENVNRIASFLDGAPKGVKEIIQGSRGPDGKPLGSHPSVLRWLVDMARQQNPAGIVLPGSGASMAKGVEDEIKTIEETMRKDRAKYNKDEGMQSRYRDLLGARERLKGGGRRAA